MTSQVEARNPGVAAYAIADELIWEPRDQVERVYRLRHKGRNWGAVRVVKVLGVLTFTPLTRALFPGDVDDAMAVPVVVRQGDRAAVRDGLRLVCVRSRRWWG